MKNYSIFPLGDSAITIDLGNYIDEKYNIKALALHGWLMEHPVPGCIDIIMAYSSVTLFYDAAGVVARGLGGHPGAYALLEALLEQAWRETEAADTPEPAEGRVVSIPVCYEGGYAPDLGSVATEKGLSPDEVVQLHTGILYRVYMMGFLPGFPYLGILDQRLTISRKSQPTPVVAGGVGIAGRQTGIYPLNSPGGWQIIGRTPVRLFDPAAGSPLLLQAGDRVKFQPIGTAEFRRLSGRPG
jgi:inhibitor of KinA